MLLFVTGLLALLAALILAFLTHPYIFFGKSGSGAGFLDFSALFVAGQWLSFWLSVASVFLLALSLKFSPHLFIPFPRIAWIPAIAAALLLLYQLGFGMPHPANRRGWHIGEMGLFHYLRAEIGAAKQHDPAARIAREFRGVWRSDSGATYRFTRSDVLVAPAGAAADGLARLCGGDIALGYQEAGPEVLKDFTGQAGDDLRAALEADCQRRLPQLCYICAERTGYFIRNGDHIWMFDRFHHMRPDARDTVEKLIPTGE